MKTIPPISPLDAPLGLDAWVYVAGNLLSCTFKIPSTHGPFLRLCGKPAVVWQPRTCASRCKAHELERR